MRAPSITTHRELWAREGESASSGNRKNCEHMNESDTFALYFNHGGKFTRIGGARFYEGGVYDRKAGFDLDKFGYFDIVDEIKDLGYEKWDCIAYKVPKTLVFFDLKDEQDVKKMVKNLSPKCKFLSIYVDGGVKKVSPNHITIETEIQNNKLGGNTVIDEKGKGKMEGIEVGSGGRARKISKVSEKLGKGDGTAGVLGASKIKKKWNLEGLEGESNKNSGKTPKKGKGNLEGLEGESAKNSVAVPKHGKGNAKGMGINIGVESDEDGVSDISWHDSDEDDVPIETDDSLGDDELGSGDDEYVEARQIISQEALRVDEIQENWSLVEGRVGLDLEGNEKMVSDYADSEGEVKSESSEEEDEYDVCPSKKKGKVRYDPKCDHRNLELTVGMRFENGFQCKQALKTWAILEGHPIRFRRVSKIHCQASCKPPCPWRLYGSLSKREQNLVIRTMGKPHECPFDIHNKQADYKWIGKEYMSVFRVRPSMTVAELDVDIKQRFSINVSRGRLHRAKHYAFELLRGTVSQHYAMLRSYLSELMRVDREGRFDLIVEEGGIFKGLYIGFSALKKGFLQGCRWIIGLDGCFLKTHLKGQLLCATAKDGNNQMYPIAWAVVEVENEATWRWFFKTLLEELGMNDGQGLTVISDQQKGLLKAVRELAPFAEHRNCARHVYCNWKKKFKGATLKNLFWAAVLKTT